jgi:uncharacterized cupredoxin-like copper-binding protein
MTKLRFLLIVLLFTLAACAPATPTATEMPFQEFTVKAVDIKFEPAVIEVVVDQPVRIIIENTGALDHDFNVDTIKVINVKSVGGEHHHSTDKEPALHVYTAPGKTARIEFTPEEVGTYEFYCSVEGHKAAGALGTLIVKENK